MLQIPVIDLAPWLADVPEAKEKIAKQVKQACEEIGFFTICGHGIPLETIEATNDAAGAFFDQPMAVKRGAEVAGGMGYIGPQGENLAASLDDAEIQDLKESLNLTLPISEQIWPTSPAALRSAGGQYYQGLITLSHQLMHIFALALGLPETWFDDKVDQPRTILRLLNYPSLTPIVPHPHENNPNLNNPGQPKQTRAGAHTDYGTLTILWSPDSRGLQAKARSGEWVDVVAPVDHFIINIGDLMMNWTNDRWISTLHQVVPHPDTHGQRRHSMAFFHNPNPDARIECIPTCVAAGETPKYPPILAKEHLERKIAKSLGQAVKL